ncbi:DUF2339 domain-containing protein [Celeribacter litoreus]|uniref:DUF2339 domain-containing protein n=1 Tax=Celeribacter litoreus TaxID=2876714 RepID=UPI001CCFBC20|nr:DUF2339 domain-containing protein [Celeribacter litoreus]MCA0043303.1 DUF2339 domain-containing protein [Celeribacter litoreus]
MYFGFGGLTTVFVLLLGVAFFVVLARLSRLQERQRSLEDKVEQLEARLSVLARRAVRTDETDARPASAPDKTDVAPEAELSPSDDLVAADERTETPEERVDAQSAAKGPWDVAATEADDISLRQIITREPAPTAIKERPTPYFLSEENSAALMAWLRANWTLAIAAVSFVLGGLFMVQYGIEKGILTPAMRVIGALILGAGLVGGGEYLRRKFGDEATPATRHLPSTFAGAGVVVLFIGILSAHALYGLVSALTALIGVVIVAAGAVLMGWLYAGVLPAIGLIGAGIAPFLVSSPDADPRPFYAYFAVIALAGLLIDSFRRWAWVSALSLVIASGGLALLHFDADFAPGLIAATLALALGALIIPERRLIPELTGAPLSGASGQDRPAFPTYLGYFGILIPTFSAVWVGLPDSAYATEVWMALATCVVLFLAVSLWLVRSPALFEAAALPVIGFFILLILQALEHGKVYVEFRNFLDAMPETPLPTTLWWLLGAAAVMGGAAFWRLKQEGQSSDEDRAKQSLFWVILSAGFVPATVFLLEFLWAPRSVIGASPWAFAVMAGAAFLVVLTQRRTAFEGVDRHQDVGLFASAAILLIALALFLLLSKAALTLGLALLVALSVLLDRRFDLKVLTWVTHLGAAVIGYRLLIDPGAFYAIDRASWPAFGLTHVSALGAFAVMAKLGRDERESIRATGESAFLSTAGLFAMLLIARVFEDTHTENWFSGLGAAIWASSTLAQIWRLTASKGHFRKLRWVFIGFTGLAAVGFATLQVILTYELLEWHGSVQGPPIFDVLALAYLPLAAVLGGGAYLYYRKRPHTSRMFLRALTILSSLSALFWGYLEIRRLWRGPKLSAPGPSDGELYTYTVAMLLLSLGVLAVAVFRRSDLLRRIAMTGVALTIVKVFLVDMGGLSGLTRVVSFVGLGLALAGLAWLNRKIDSLWPDRSKPEETEVPMPEEDET